MIKLFSKDTFNKSGVLLDFMSNFDVSCLSKYDCILLTEDYTFIDAFNEQLGVTNGLVVWKSPNLADLLSSVSLSDFLNQCIAYESSRERNLVIYANPGDVSKIIWGYLKAVYPMLKASDLAPLYDCYKVEMASLTDSIPSFSELTDDVLGMDVGFLPPEAHAVLPIEFQYVDCLIRGDQSQLSYTFWTTLGHMILDLMLANLSTFRDYVLTQNYRIEEIAGAGKSLQDLMNDPDYKYLWSQIGLTTADINDATLAKSLALAGCAQLTTLAEIDVTRNQALLTGMEWYHDLTASSIDLHIHAALLDYFHQNKGSEDLAKYGV